MILAIDIGNTNTVIGCCKDNEILFVERLSTDSSRTVLEYAISIKNVLELYQIQPGALKGSIISSVVPPLTNLFRDAIRKIVGKEPMIVGPGVKTGLNILMDNPGQVGSDLIVNAVAALAEHPVPLIIIDLGTATTISVVDSKKNYIGGMILPGIRVSLDSLVNRTSQLHRISLEAPKRLIGKNTAECMKSGVIHGNAACIDGMIDRIEKELKTKATVIATGGLAGSIIPHCTHEIILDDALLLKGLLYIYKKNS
ncbi:MAG TPA: type III pantothenate kinase [Candidatus Choladousia intestinigallinarum]|nr:type III pantothenate kinase [Candidatus Choladousia intestinigallinarum]